MKLGLAIGYSRAHVDIPVKLVQRAEELGYDSVWTAEAYGSDAVTPLAFLAAHTSRIKLGTGIMQLAARTPANAAMSAATVDAMAGGGRFIAGLGVSGPQIVEGWYGQPWGKPYWRIRDYVAIMRKIFAREAPVTHDGREISLPYTGPGALGIGKPLKSILHMNPDIPIFLATGNEATVKLTAQPAEAGGGALCRRHGSQDQELPQRHHDAPRLRPGGPAHPGTLSGGPQGRGHRRGARRMGRHEIAGRSASAHPPALSRLGGLRRRFAQRALASARSAGSDGRGRATQLVRSKSSGPRASRSLMIMSERDARGPEDNEKGGPREGRLFF